VKVVDILAPSDLTHPCEQLLQLQYIRGGTLLLTPSNFKRAGNLRSDIFEEGHSGKNHPLMSHYVLSRYPIHPLPRALGSTKPNGETVPNQPKNYEWVANAVQNGLDYLPDDANAPIFVPYAGTSKKTLFFYFFLEISNTQKLRF